MLPDPMTKKINPSTPIWDDNTKNKQQKDQEQRERDGDTIDVATEEQNEEERLSEFLLKQLQIERGEFPEEQEKMKLISESIEDIEYITEDSDDGKKNYRIRGVFLQADIKNRNGRVYPLSVLQKETARYNKEYIQKKRAFGELGHPDGPTVNLERVSHMITSLHPDGKNFIGEAKIMDTPYGKIVKNLIDEGAKLGVSSRGMGSLTPGRGGSQVVKDDFYLATAADIVADPSAPNAFVEGIMEGKEWIWDNGAVKEMTIAAYKKELDVKYKMAQAREEKAAEIFTDFMSKL